MEGKAEDCGKSGMMAGGQYDSKTLCPWFLKNWPLAPSQPNNHGSGQANKPIKSIVETTEADTFPSNATTNKKIGSQNYSKSGTTY